jgi:general secretion pathway protein E
MEIKNTQDFQLSYKFARENGIFISDINENNLEVLTSDDVKLNKLSQLEAKFKRPLVIKSLSGADFFKHISSFYSENTDKSEDIVDGLGDQINLEQLASDLPKTEDLLDDSTEAPVIRLINAVLSEAIKSNASDIHIEPYEKNLSIRFRVDGILKEILSPSSRIASLLNARIKVMANLDIAEKRVPQDGRISLKLGEKWVDLRVSTLPSNYGERIVLRLLDKSEAKFNLDDLGMPAEQKKVFTRSLAQNNGIILVTGPTGSGKTTTLYAGLNLLNDQSRNILTVEDPIEYAVDGIGQTQVNNKVGMTFAAGLRAILRQDPDVVMVGEIRDKETAEIAIQASLTGHLVLSTIHTNDTLGAITRLIDMGVEPYLLASSLRTIISQRLVRKLSPDGETFSGRQGIFEILDIDQNVKELINDDFSEKKVRDIIDPQHDFLEESGQKLIQKGVTTLEEVRRVLMEA